MPLDTPKIAVQYVDDEDLSWVDLDDIFNQERVLFLSGRVDDKNANDLIALILSLVIEDPDEDLFLFINCPGGSIYAGLALYDMIQLVPPSVYTIGVGLAASTGSYILSGGDVNKRLAFPHTLITLGNRLHRIRKRKRKRKRKPMSMRRLRAEMMRRKILHNNMIQGYAARTGRSESIIEMDMERASYMTAMEAKNYGIIDRIVSS